MTLSKYEIERGFSRLLFNGDETAIANELGHSVGYIQQLYDPNNERESHLFRAIKELRAWRRSNAERGAKALAMFVHFVEAGLKETATNDSKRARKQLQNEISEWQIAEMEDAPNKREELMDVHLHTGRLLQIVQPPAIREQAAVMVEARKAKKRTA